MKTIKILVENIKEELCDAEKYVKQALDMKDMNNDSAYQLFYRLAQEELGHATALHKEAVDEIATKKAELKAKDIETPAFMLEYWQDEHKDYIEKYAKIKSLLELIKE